MEALAKFALNSTLGTDKFEPLDKLINGFYTFIPNDNVLRYLVQVHYGDSDSPRIAVKLKSNLSGQLKIVGKYQHLVSGKTSNTSIVVSNSKGVVYSATIPISSASISSGSPYGTEYSDILEIERNEEYTFEFTAYNNQYIYEIYLAGTTIGGRVFDEVIE